MVKTEARLVINRNNRNFKVVDDALTSDCVCRGPFGEIVGRNEFKLKVALPLFDSFPDIK